MKGDKLLQNILALFKKCGQGFGWFMEFSFSLLKEIWFKRVKIRYNPYTFLTLLLSNWLDTTIFWITSFNLYFAELFLSTNVIEFLTETWTPVLCHFFTLRGWAVKLAAKYFCFHCHVDGVIAYICCRQCVQKNIRNILLVACFGQSSY